MSGYDETGAEARLAALASQISELRTFLDRRVSEVSAEVAASVELQDMQTRDIMQRIGDVVGKIAAHADPEDRGGPGLALEGLIRLNADAANRIMDAAEHISADIAQPDVPERVRESVLRHVTVVFEACGFQDLTGQRIARALAFLRGIEEIMLGRTVPTDVIEDRVRQPEVDAMFRPAARKGGQDGTP
jgi:chemotaxis protein CheZ